MTMEESQGVSKSMIDDLNVIVVDMTQQMFGHALSLTDEGGPSPVPPFNDSFLVTMGLGGDNHQGQLVLGFSHHARETMIRDVLELAGDKDQERELANSAIGELANAIAGQYVVLPEVVERFGRLHISVPIVWEREAGQSPRFMRSDGRAGKLRLGEQEVNTYLSVQFAEEIDTGETGSPPLLSFSLADLQDMPGDEG
jgi:hypothetical protein